jgi:ectoine hydroxylase-related dioxygenase (phytanoyl-CoA dioxygenase family)
METVRLTTQQRDHFSTKGWLLLHDLLGVPLDDLQDEVARLGAGGETPWMDHYEMTDAGRRLARSEDFTPHSELLRTVLCQGPLVEVASQLLDEPALLYKEKVNYKLAGGAGFAPHQDKPAYPYVDQVLSVMVAIDDSTEANGCLEVVDGWHQEVLEQDDQGCIAAEVVDRLSWAPVEMAAGDCLFFHALTPHRSGPNSSGRDRRALFPTYNGASEGDLRDAYYAAKREIFASSDPEAGRVRLSLIGDFQGRPA